MEIPNNPEIIFGNNMRFLRKKHRLTLEELGDIIGVKKSTVANYETGSSEPTLSKLVQIAKYFKVSVDDILTQEISMKDGIEEPESGEVIVRILMDSLSEMKGKMNEMEALFSKVDFMELGQKKPKKYDNVKIEKQAGF